MTAALQQTPVDLGMPRLPAYLASGSVHLNRRSLVINLADSRARIGGDIIGTLPPGQSTVLHEVDISGDSLLVIAHDQSLSAEHVREQRWKPFYGAGAATELLRGPQVALGAHRLDLGAFLGQPPRQRATYEVRVNLWFAPQRTACGIHNQHDFLEFHTQVWGTGVMQKFHAAESPMPYEEQGLASGATTAAPFCRSADDWTYPWHQYTAHTDSVWLAVEYHAAWH